MGYVGTSACSFADNWESGDRTRHFNTDSEHDYAGEKVCENFFRLW